VNGHNRVRRPLTGQPAVLGIDLGTNGIKVVVTCPDGRILGRAVAGYPVSVPAPGYAEADPRDWWASTRRAVQAALAEAGDPRLRVTGLAVAGQMHGVVLVDDRGAALRPAILWLDQRAVAETSLYQEMPCDYTAPLRNRPSPGTAGPLLCWLATHEPHTLRSSWWALQPKDWLRLRLTGQAATDPTDASGTLMFDLARDSWAEPLLDKLGLPRDKLPPVRQPNETAGGLLSGPAAELGLAPGIPVTVGAGDTAAALYAAGLRPDEAMLTLGSGGRWVIPVASLPGEPSGQAGGFPAGAGTASPGTGNPGTGSPGATSPGATSPGTGSPGTGSPGTTSLYRAVGDAYYRLAPVRNVGTSLDWVRNLVGATWEELYETASRPDRADGPHFDPFLAPGRCNPAAPGGWTGLTLDHEREDLMRGALDGVAVLLRQHLDDLRAAGHAPRRVIVGGGGTRHPAWRALLSETIGLPLTPAPVGWLAPAGAAQLAGA
jgi:xylulokinase